MTLEEIQALEPGDLLRFKDQLGERYLMVLGMRVSGAWSNHPDLILEFWDPNHPEHRQTRHIASMDNPNCKWSARCTVTRFGHLVRSA